MRANVRLPLPFTPWGAGDLTEYIIAYFGRYVNRFHRNVTIFLCFVRVVQKLSDFWKTFVQVAQKGEKWGNGLGSVRACI